LADRFPKALYDGKSNSLYIIVSKGEEGFIEIAPDINLEIGKNGKVIGIEILKAKKVLSKIRPLAQVAR